MIVEFFIDHWQVILFILTLMFNAGIMYKTFKDKPSAKTVAEMIDKAFVVLHASHEKRVLTLEIWKDDLIRHNVIVARTLVNETERAHLTAQRIELNLKRICNKFKIEYLESNK